MRLRALLLTLLRIGNGFVYLAVILDLFSRRVIGWAISKHIDAELALSALRQAIATQEPPPGCIHHSERGVQYLCNVTVQSTPLLTQPDQVLRLFSSETTAPASFTFDNNCGEIRH